MEFQGKIINELPQRGGTNARGEWKAQDFVIETDEQYPKKMCFSVMNDRIEEFKNKKGLHIGAQVCISFDVDAHEYNGKWYNSIRAWDCKPIAQQATPETKPEAQAIPNAVTEALAPFQPDAVNATPQAGNNLFDNAMGGDIPF